jgi:L-threonylcarbamoyladenylate synthase
VIYRGTARNLARMAKLLRAGKLVGVPTETVYGLAADAFDGKACRAIFAAKGRPATDPLIVHVLGWRGLGEVAETNAAARRLAREFWPGPLTLVLRKKAVVPDVVTAGRDSVAVRAPSHPLLRRLLALTGRPLAAPSANPFGYVSPTTAAHVQRGLGGKVRHILDGGPSKIGLESTIVDLRDPKRPRLLRPGKITRREIEGVLGVRVVVGKRPAARVRAGRVAPGQFARHYSPHTPVVPHARMSEKGAGRSGKAEAWLFLARPAALRGANIFWLDGRGDLRGAGRRLFSTLRRIDEGGFRKIHVELAKGHGLAEAINDRIRRAGMSSERRIRPAE